MKAHVVPELIYHFPLPKRLCSSVSSHMSRVCRAWRAGLPARRWARTLSSLPRAQLEYDAGLAELSGLVYTTHEALGESLETRGLRLLAEGTAPFTRWFVAEDSRGELTLCARGVSWRQPGLDFLGLGRTLLSIWPADVPGLEGRVAVHAGVAEVAAELRARTAPWLEEGAAASKPLRLVGHSLGGSLVQALLADRHGATAWTPARPVELVTFGAPPVLKSGSKSPSSGAVDDSAEGPSASAESALGDAPLVKDLGPNLSARHYVLGQDPVPGLLLSAKPLFKAMFGSGGARLAALGGPLGALLRDLPALKGASPRLPGLPAYQAAGPVYLVRWSQAQGHSVVRLTAQEVARELAVDVDKLARNPFELMQARGCGARAAVRRGSKNCLASYLSNTPPSSHYLAGVDGSSA